MSTNAAAAAPASRRRRRARAARAACPGRGVENIRKPSTCEQRCQRANSAGGSATACSIMLAHSSCARPSSASRPASTPARWPPAPRATTRAARRAARCAGMPASARPRRARARGYAARSTAAPPPMPAHQSSDAPRRVRGSAAAARPCAAPPRRAATARSARRAKRRSARAATVDLGVDARPRPSSARRSDGRHAAQYIEPMAIALSPRCRRPRYGLARSRGWPDALRGLPRLGRAAACARDCIAALRARRGARCAALRAAGAGRRARAAAPASRAPPPFDARRRRGRLRAPVGPPGHRLQVPRRARPRRRRSARRWPTRVRAARRCRADAAAAGAAGRGAAARARLQPGLGAGAARRPPARLRRRAAPAAAPARHAAPGSPCRARERAGNVRGAFALEPRRRAALRGRARRAGRRRHDHRRHRRRGRARRCWQAGAASVDVWVLARTPRPASMSPQPTCSTSSSSHPEIPPNTGNVIRLAANTGCALHLVEPLGFSMDDRLLRAPASTTTSTPTCGATRRGRRSSTRAAPAAGAPVRLHHARRPRRSPTSPGSPATGSCSAARPRACRLRARRLRARAARAPADAPRPAQPQPEQRGRGGGVRGLAAERLRGRRPERPAVGDALAGLGSRLAPPSARSSAALGGVSRARRAPSHHRLARSASRRRSARARAQHHRRAVHAFGHVAELGQDLRRSGAPCASAQADLAVARQVAGGGEHQVAQARQAHEGFGAARRARRPGASSRPGRA